MTTATAEKATVAILRCAVQKYAWGKIGNESKVIQLVSSAFPDFQFNEKDPYAELWMGTHPSGPSVIVEPSSLKGTLLKDWVHKYPETLGSKVTSGFGNDLPFLFKVLSVNKALSIQAHPDKPSAEKLHREKPDKYPDPNHKPEMAIALTEFEALCGFRPLPEIVQFLKDLPELRSVVGDDAVEELTKVSKEDTNDADIITALKRCFTTLMTSPEDRYKENLRKLHKRLQESSDANCSDEIRKLFLRIYSQFPDDIGCFGMFFFNYLTLQPGEAIFLAANEPHAYLYGDCIECMACSDNVVRAGLTPKYVDVQTLCNMLTYKCKGASEQMFPGIADPQDSCITTYKPPVPEFAVQRIKIPLSLHKNYTIRSLESGSLCLVLEGEAVLTSLSEAEVKQGSVFYIPAGETVDLTLKSDTVIYRAYTPV